MEEYKQLSEEEEKQFYKELSEKLERNEDFINAVQKTFDKYIYKKTGYNLLSYNLLQFITFNMILSCKPTSNLVSKPAATINSFAFFFNITNLFNQ